MKSYNRQNRKVVHAGHIKDNFKPVNLELICCDHNEYCFVKKLLDKAHCSKDYARTCQTAKYYSRYGRTYNQLGVGS